MATRIRSITGSLALLAALVAALAGCGSDGEGSTATDGADASSPAASESPSTSASTDPTTSPSATSSLPSTDDPTEEVQLPACDTVWVVGQELPRNYQGCLEGEKEVQANGLYCEFGKPLFTYKKRFYAVENGPINRTDSPLAKDKAFQTAQRKCGG